MKVRSIFNYMFQKILPLRLSSFYYLYQSLNDLGWQKSCDLKISVDKNGNPIPWLTYPAVKFIEGRLQSDWSVFEYGSGNSTLWWSKRVGHVISCEHAHSWFQSIVRSIPDNVTYLHRPLQYDGDYCRVVDEYHCEFDVVVIDGRDRVNCAFHSISSLKPSGVIIWDNSDRKEYKEGLSFLRNQGFRQIDFVGFSPCSWIISCTSIFYRNNNCMGI